MCKNPGKTEKAMNTTTYVITTNFNISRIAKTGNRTSKPLSHPSFKFARIMNSLTHPSFAMQPFVACFGFMIMSVHKLPFCSMSQ